MKRVPERIRQAARNLGHALENLAEKIMPTRPQPVPIRVRARDY